MPESYRAVRRRQRRRVERRRRAAASSLGSGDERLPQLRARALVQGGEDLAAARVDHRQPARPARRRPRRCPAPAPAAIPPPTSGFASAWASARAVATPIRSPVNEPGPTPTAIASTALPAAGLARRRPTRSRPGARGRAAGRSPGPGSTARSNSIRSPPVDRRDESSGWRCRSRRSDPRRSARSTISRGRPRRHGASSTRAATRTSPARPGRAPLAVTRAIRRRRSHRRSGSRRAARVLAREPSSRAGRGRGGRRGTRALVALPDREGRRGDGLGHAERPAGAPDEGRLARRRARRATQDDVARAARPAATPRARPPPVSRGPLELRSVVNRRGRADRRRPRRARRARRRRPDSGPVRRGRRRPLESSSGERGEVLAQRLDERRRAKRRGRVEERAAGTPSGRRAVHLRVAPHLRDPGRLAGEQLGREVARAWRSPAARSARTWSSR